jgi:outer membrane immunogenic protein
VKLRTLLFSTTAISTLCVAPALAADLPTKAPAPAALFSWTGFYVGGNLGGVWGRSTVSEDVFLVGSFTNNPSGVIGGFQAGYNWQAGNLVYGVEADIALSSAEQTTDLGGGFFHRSSLSGLSTLRGRIGIAMSPTLLYLTGGAAFAWLKHEQVDFSGTASRGSTAWGWTIGAGIEHAFANRWSIKAEYLYTRFNDTTGPSPVGYVYRFNDANSVARVGINYRF